MKSLINQSLQQYRGNVDEIIKDLHHLTVSIGNEELAKTVSDLRNRINEPFMFVIVGEVKAGKSSFINALLETEKEICKVSPAPCTDTIQQIMFDEKEHTQVINPWLKQLFYPIDILKEIAIVDTPGTNTIIEKHQEITEQFIPASDLIVFVFESKNPYRQSAWDFFQFIHQDWRKKIIFVLQQKDLLPAADLAINVQGVQDAAQKKGLTHPLIFPVSAKDELEGRKSDSGFDDIRTYIQENITGGKAPLLKLRNNVETGLNIAERIGKGITLRQEQFRYDTAFREDIRQTLVQQELKSNHQVDILLETLLGGYDKIIMRKERELEEGLSVFALVKRSFVSLFSKESSSKEWFSHFVKDMETELNNTLRSRLNDGINDLAESIQQMAKMIDLKIKSSKTILKNDNEIFDDIADKRSNILKELQDAFARFMSGTENFTGADIFEDGKSLTPNIVTGSGLAVIGVVLAAVTKVAVLDITGGVIATVGLLFAGVTIGVNRGKVLSNFRKETAAGRKKLQEELEDKLRTYIRVIKQKIDGNFVGFDAMIQNEAEQIRIIQMNHEAIDTRLHKMQETLKN
ncbi:MAG: dynamin family protein [Bacteroidia bacterium]|nr:dynamin family protein [Bacteroidia bacterium]